MLEELTDPPGAAAPDLASPKRVVATLCALLLGLLFLVSGSWKLTDPFTWSQMLGQFRVPAPLAMPGALLLGVAETFSAILIVTPRFRRWGAILISLMLVVFMAYIGVNYGALAGKECSCFPIVKRSVGPGFFLGDAVMLLMAIVAALWSPPPAGVRPALVALGAVAVFAAVGYGVNAARQSGMEAPPSITVDGQLFNLRQGRVFLFFYDPECMHCDAAARRMAKLSWKDTKVIGIPTRVPQFAQAFLHDTGLRAATSNDVALLRKTFSFVDPPYGAALENGRVKATVTNFDESEPARTLVPAGFAEQTRAAQK